MEATLTAQQEGTLTLRQDLAAKEYMSSSMSLEEKRAAIEDLFENTLVIDHMSEEEIDQIIARCRREWLDNGGARYIERKRNRKGVLNPLAQDVDYELLKEGRDIVNKIRSAVSASGIDEMTMDEIDAEIACSRQERRERG